MVISHFAAFMSVIALLQTADPPPRSVPPTAPAATAGAPTARNMEWTIDGVKRQAIVYVPANATKTDTPVVFALHGHGGTARNAATTFAYQRHWPEAICVYMEGLPSPGITDPKGKRNGWQKSVGDLRDRDLKFFDAVLATLKHDYKVDECRIYATGHSNGGAFTYLLWAARGDVFAAVAPSAGGLRDIGALKPKPAMHIAGEQDTTVPFAMQQRIMERVRKLNGCQAEGQPWAKSGILVGTLYPSKNGTPFVSVLYPGTHTFPRQAPELIVKFFKEHSKRARISGREPAQGALPADSAEQ